MKKAILRILKMEFENLLYNRFSWILLSLYAIIAMIISTSEYLQETYFDVISSVPVMLMNMIAPIFLILIIVLSLSQVFAGEIENNTNQIPNTCYMGKKGRNCCKIIAGILYSFSMALLICIITFSVCFFTKHFLNANQEIIKDIGYELRLDFSWNVWQHFLFAVISLLSGSIVFSFIVLFISGNSKNSITSIGISALFTLFEYLFNRFSFPVILKEINIFVFFKPYYLYVFNVFRYSPYFNLVLLFLLFLLLFLILNYSKKILKGFKTNCRILFVGKGMK